MNFIHYAFQAANLNRFVLDYFDLALIVLYTIAEKCDRGKPPKQLFKTRLLCAFSFLLQSWGPTQGYFACQASAVSEIYTQRPLVTLLRWGRYVSFAYDTKLRVQSLGGSEILSWGLLNTKTHGRSHFGWISDSCSYCFTDICRSFLSWHVAVYHLKKKNREAGEMASKRWMLLQRTQGDSRSSMTPVLGWPPSVVVF